MKPIRNKHVQNLFGISGSLQGLDGELVVGSPTDKNLMQQTHSGVMSFEGRPRVKYYVFDKWDEPGIFHNRLAVAKSIIDAYGGFDVVYLDHKIVTCFEELLRYETDTLAQGYEGVMLRSLLGPYKQNRSTLKEAYLLKLKRFTDGEAIVTGVEPLYRNTNPAMVDERGFTKRSSDASGLVNDEQLGSLTVRDLVTGAVFSIGSGFTTAQRTALWQAREDGLVGRLVKYKSFTHGVKDAPRFPIFLGFRDPLDMS